MRTAHKHAPIIRRSKFFRHHGLNSIVRPLYSHHVRLYSYDFKGKTPGTLGHVSAVAHVRCFFSRCARLGGFVFFFCFGFVKELNMT